MSLANCLENTPVKSKHNVIVSGYDRTGWFQFPIVVRLYETETLEEAIVRTLTGKLNKSFAEVCAERKWKNGRWKFA